MDAVSYSPSPYISHAVLRCFIKDWSGSGLCLMTLQPHEQGEEIIIDHIVVPSSKRAVVRWFKMLAMLPIRSG